MNLIPLLFFIIVLSVNALASNSTDACQGHDFPCQGAHGSQANCCAGSYCHKNDPTWSEGRCYYRTQPSATCVIHDGVCHGQHGETGDCCTGTYCHKNHPTWAEGRCYFVNSGNEGGEKK